MGEQLYDMDRHLLLSGSLAYQLTAADRKTVLQNVQKIILDGCDFSDEDGALLLDSLDYICDAYGDRHRRLGPPAVLHPIRATATMARAVAPTPDVTELLAVLFHDKMEDLPKEAYDDEPPEVFENLEKRFYELLDRLPQPKQDFLAARLIALTSAPNQSYNNYIYSMLLHAAKDLSTLRCKLADRLDNTLDMRLDYQDPLQSSNFYKVVFDIMVIKTEKSNIAMTHPIKSEMNGEQRLRQLFKNIVLLSLIRRGGMFPVGKDPIIDRLCSALVTATSLEAQRNILHIFNYHMQDARVKRDSIAGAMEYCKRGGINEVTNCDGSFPLDGLFEYFAQSKGCAPAEKFVNFYDNKPLMVQACIAFIAICSKFSSEADFYVRGITGESIAPE